MAEYKPNSQRSKMESKKELTENRKVEKVIAGNAKIKKKSDAQKFLGSFISEDVADVKTYVLMGILVPAIKKAISDIVTDGVDMLLYGNTRDRKKRGNGGYVSYSSYSSDRRDDRRTSTRSTRYDWDDIILDSRGEAEEVLDQLNELIDSYGVASVADLYDLVGLTVQYTENRYGWTSIRNADIINVREGYLLKLPRPKPIG